MVNFFGANIIIYYIRWIVKIVQLIQKMLHVSIFDLKIKNFTCNISEIYYVRKSVGYFPNCFLKQFEK